MNHVVVATRQNRVNAAVVVRLAIAVTVSLLAVRIATSWVTAGVAWTMVFVTAAVIGNVVMESRLTADYRR